MVPSFPTVYRTSYNHALRALLLLLLGLLLSAGGAEAQVKQWLKPDSIPDIQPVYNIAEDEFILGTMLGGPSTDPGDTAGILWSLARWLNASDWIVPSYFYRNGGATWAQHLVYDTLAMRAGAGERFNAAVDPIDRIAGHHAEKPEFGQMIEVFPFDSVQSPYASIGHVDTDWRFLGVDETKGIVDTNLFYDNTTREKTDWPWTNTAPRERVYSATTDTGLVAEHVAVYYHRSVSPALSWADHLSQTSDGEHADFFFDRTFNTLPSDQPRMFYVALKGHLFTNGTASPSDTIFLIELYHVITPGDTLIDDNLNKVVDENNIIERALDTFAVTKAMLTEGAPDIPFDKYRDISFGIDGRYRLGNSNLVGPFHPQQYRRVQVGSPIIDARIRWTGKEKAAFRSLMFRNEQAELMYGSSQESQDFRQRAVDSARRVLHGLDQNGDIDLSAPLRTSILRLESGHEAAQTGYGTYRAIHRMLKDSLVYNNDADSIPAGIIDHSLRRVDHAFHVGGLDYTHLEYNYMNWYKFQSHDKTDPPFDDIPSIFEHNGGRDDELQGPPELKLTRDSIELYTEAIQRALYGWFDPAHYNTPNAHNNYAGIAIRDLSTARLGAHLFGKKFIAICGATNIISYDTVNITWTGDMDSLTNKDYVTRLGHQIEVSELRNAANLALCYGADGMTYYWLNTNLNLLGGKTLTFPKGPNGPDTLLWGSRDYFGIVGESWDEVLNGTSTDVVDLHLRSQGIWTLGPFIPDGHFRDTVEDVWVGWKTLPEGMKSLNDHIETLGTEMKRRGLRWRDAYSVHHQAENPTTSDTDNDFPGVRPLDASEIITQVRSWDTRTEAIDSTWGTYVELGLFYTIQDTAADPDPMLDTNYCWVQNRRTFQRPPDISDTTPRGRLMDSLTENRTIELRFNVPNPDTSNQYNVWIRVREVLPSTDTLALLGLRSALDTFVVGNTGKALVTLPPGGGTLLEITYSEPDESMTNGILARNNQRKIFYDSTLDCYFSTYHRYDTGLGDWQVYLRKSLPISESASVLWEPFEHALSDPLDLTDQRRTQNTHPSLTMYNVSDTSRMLVVAWTAHPNDTSHALASEREVLTRDILFRDFNQGNPQQGTSSYPQQIWWYSPLRTVGYHKGLDAERWGTPVVSSCDFGEYFAYSDSTVGIITRARVLDSIPSPFSANPPDWSIYDSVEIEHWGGFAPIGQYPTMPPFGHRGRNDSTVGLAWQTSLNFGLYTGIMYARMHLIDTAATPEIWSLLHETGTMFISPNEDEGLFDPVAYLHPSLDATQDGLDRLHEAATWERHNAVDIYKLNTYVKTEHYTELYFRPLGISGSGAPTAVGDVLCYVDGPYASGTNTSYGYPVISSQNNVRTIADSTVTPLFSLIYELSGSAEIEMKLLEGKYQTAPAWVSAAPQEYLYGGEYPNGAASATLLTSRYAGLYAEIPDSALRTSRQFYAKSRPDSYQSEGIETSVLYDVPLGFSVTARLYDSWWSNDTESDGLEINSFATVDSLSELFAQLRSKPFVSSDSTRIGVDVWCRFAFDDSLTALGEEIDCIVELVDSTTGSVVWQLDSFALDVSNRSLYARVDTTLDLLSGTYYVRLRMTSGSFPAWDLVEDSVQYSRTQLYGYVPGVVSKRARRVGGETGSGIRVSAQPNPFTGETEFRFSISRREHVTLKVYDGLGREVARLIEKELYDPGRYAVEFQAGELPSGQYIVELQTLNDRVVEKVVVKR